MRVTGFRAAVFGSLVGVGLLGGGVTVHAAAAQQTDSYIAVLSSDDALAGDRLERAGHRVTADLHEAKVMVVQTGKPAALAGVAGVAGIARDRSRVLIRKEPQTAVRGMAAAPSGCASTATTCPYQWDLARIHVPDAWKTTMGSPSIKVAVLDTGLTSSHEEVRPNYDKAESKSFVQPTAACPEDAATFASTEDFNGHGTWTSTHVAGVNGKQMTGIAPATTLVNVKVVGACGFGFDSWFLQGMFYASSIGARVESISLQSYLCAYGVVPDSSYCSDAAQVGTDPVVFQAYVNLVDLLGKRGTLVVAAAANELVNVENNGRVTSRASLAVSSLSADPGNDLHGLAEAPGGVPQVIAVAAINRMTVPAKPGETRFGQFGAGQADQLTFYSNYGPAISVSAPGGVRRYNLPLFDCLVPICAALGPSSPTGTDNTGDFGALGVDPVTGAPCNNCYVFAMGTSMATPQVAGVAALALAVHPELSTRRLARLLRRSVTDFRDPNATPPADEQVGQTTFNYDLDYDGAPVPNAKMGSGVIDAAKAVRFGDSADDQRGDDRGGGGA